MKTATDLAAADSTRKQEKAKTSWAGRPEGVCKKKGHKAGGGVRNLFMSHLVTRTSNTSSKFGDGSGSNSLRARWGNWQGGQHCRHKVKEDRDLHLAIEDLEAYVKRNPDETIALGVDNESEEESLSRPGAHKWLGQRLGGKGMKHECRAYQPADGSTVKEYLDSV